MSVAKPPANVEEVLPNDAELGRRNCRWRELIKKYETIDVKDEEKNSMDIDTALALLDQDVNFECSGSEAEEATADEKSDEEKSEVIMEQLKTIVPKRQRQWESNGLKEILDDSEFRMLSHEKVENWLQNHMNSITRHYKVHYETEQVTTVTETRMDADADADADSLYSVDTAQYIRSNKQTSNKMKVTTMIKKYAVTSSVRRMTTLGIIVDEQKADRQSSVQLSPPPPRALTRSESACDVKKALPPYKQAVVPKHPADHLPRSGPKSPPEPVDRRNRRKVFKKTVPRRRQSMFEMPVRPTARQPVDTEQMYAKALEQCARQKKAKAFRRRASQKFAIRKHSTSMSSSSSSDSDEVFWRPKPSKGKPSTTPVAVDVPKPHAAQKTSPSEREILEPFQSITLGAQKRQRTEPAGPVAAAEPPKVPTKKRSGILTDVQAGVVIYQPKVIRPELPSSERITLRMEHLTLTGVTKQHQLEKFRNFNYRVHPNSTIRFFPSESADEEDESKRQPVPSTDTENSYDDDDPILTFNPRSSTNLCVVEIPYCRPAFPAGNRSRATEPQPY